MKISFIKSWFKTNELTNLVKKQGNLDDLSGLEGEKLKKKIEKKAQNIFDEFIKKRPFGGFFKDSRISAIKSTLKDLVMLGEHDKAFPKLGHKKIESAFREQLEIGARHKLANELLSHKEINPSNPYTPQAQAPARNTYRTPQPNKKWIESDPRPIPCGSAKRELPNNPVDEGDRLDAESGAIPRDKTETTIENHPMARVAAAETNF